jgi:hypothetical protein
MIGIVLLFGVTPLASAYLAWRGGVSLGRAVVVGLIALPVAMAMWLLAMSLVGLGAALLNDQSRAESVHQYAGWAAALGAVIYWHAVALLSRNAL